MYRKCEVYISKFTEKRLKKLPYYIIESFYAWVRTVELEGIYYARKLPGYHDEPLKGKRSGQRSVRLSRGYRIFYEISTQGEVEIVGIIEVNKHEY